MLHSSIPRWCAAAAGASSTTGAAGAAGNETGKVVEKAAGKFKAEFMKMLKMQLVLVPICVVGLLWMYPPPSADEDRKLREEYDKNAGWKT